MLCDHQKFIIIVVTMLLFTGYNPTKDTVSKHWCSTPMTYQKFNEVLANEDLPTENDLITRFR